MSKIGWRSGERVTEIRYQLSAWNQKTRWGKVFDRSTAFVDPDGNLHSPLVTWVEFSRIQKLELDPEAFLPIPPDFAIELRAVATEPLETWHQQMIAYREWGVRLAWLINLPDRQLEIYHGHRDRAILESPTTITGEDILPWFELDLNKVW
jgi:Uma2 family endonuclease